MLQAAVAAWRRKEYQQSVEHLERASKLAPENINILLDLGGAHGMCFDYSAADRCFEQACRLAPEPRKAEALTAAGIRSLDFGDFEMARGFFERALQSDADSGEILIALAESYERANQLEEAIQMADRALSLKTQYPPALLVRARLARQKGQLGEAEDLVRQLIQKSQDDIWTRSRAWYELGGILDRQERYDEAMAAFREGKALVRPSAANTATALRKVQEYLKEMEKSITAEVLQRWFEAGKLLGPPRSFALLCGHPRSGTTLLEQALNSHPQIISAEETRIMADEAYLPLERAFPQDTPTLRILDKSSLAALKQSRENYLRCAQKFVRQPTENRILIDKNPAMNALIPTVVRIFPEAKFLVALRDPRDVCLSCFMQPLTITPISSAYLSLENTTKQYASTMGFLRVMLARMRNAHLEIRYEDVVNDFESSLRPLLEFLGVPWNDGVLHFGETSRNKLVRSPTYSEVKKPVYKTAVRRWQHYQKHLEPCLAVLDPLVKAFGYD
jgi:tetratricopeptide (TPR) repeat protein